MHKKIREADMYEPVKQFFQAQGYQVNGEVRGCDMTALRRDGADVTELAVVELKKSFCLQLLYQAVDRFSITDQVYVCIPRPARLNDRYRRMVALVKKIGLGLLTVAMDSPVRSVDLIAFPQDGKPGNARKRQRLLGEIAGRTLDANTGGGVGRKLVTAFREQAIKILCVLEAHGPLTPANMVAAHGCPVNTRAIVYANHYGWFCRLGKGLYDLTAQGRDALTDPAFGPLVDYYRGG